MEQDLKPQRSLTRTIIERAYSQVNEEYGVSKEELFMASLGYSAAGLVLVNLS